MKYEISSEQREVIIQLADIALKQGGLSNWDGVNSVLSAMNNPIKEPEVTE